MQGENRQSVRGFEILIMSCQFLHREIERNAHNPVNVSKFAELCKSICACGCDWSCVIALIYPQRLQVSVCLIHCYNLLQENTVV